MVNIITMIRGNVVTKPMRMVVLRMNGICELGANISSATCIAASVATRAYLVCILGIDRAFDGEPGAKTYKELQMPRTQAVSWFQPLVPALWPKTSDAERVSPFMESKTIKVIAAPRIEQPRPNWVTICSNLCANEMGIAVHSLVLLLQLEECCKGSPTSSKDDRKIDEVKVPGHCDVAGEPEGGHARDGKGGQRYARACQHPPANDGHQPTMYAANRFVFSLAISHTA